MNSSIPGTANIAARPDLATPDYQQPMKDDLLWVYEGLTEYLGDVLTARSGLLTPGAVTRSRWPTRLRSTTHRPGRDWRPLQDTADARRFCTTRRGLVELAPRDVDFYEEGELLWLDVDATLRRLTKDQKSMNDFCRVFHGGSGGEPDLKTYTFEDVVAGLNASLRMIGPASCGPGSMYCDEDSD